MFKPTASLQKMLRRLPLSTKQAGKEYYKGNRVGKLGTISRYGNFHPDWSCIRTFVYPPMGTKDSELTPFVSHATEKTVRLRKGYKAYPKKLTGEDYLRMWKINGGYEPVEGLEQTYDNMPEVEEVRTRENMPEVSEEKSISLEESKAAKS